MCKDFKKRIAAQKKATKKGGGNLCTKVLRLIINK